MKSGNRARIATVRARNGGTVNDNTEPKGQMELPQNGTSSPVRLAVFELRGSERSHLGTITLSKGEGSTWNLQAGGPSDASVEKLRPFLARFAEERRIEANENKGQPAISPAMALADLLAGEGFLVEELPAGDHQVSFQIDLNDGLVIGTHAAMHALAASGDPIGRRVFEAIAGSLGNAAKELADEIDRHLASDNRREAVLAIEREVERGLFSLRPNESLMNALMRLDVSDLPPDDKRMVRECRLVVAQRLDRFDLAGLEADAILKEDSGTNSPEQKATLKMAVALGFVKKGHPETGLSMLRELVREPSDLTAEGRGWAWRNISFSLPADEPEARLTAKLSADAFLEAGKKEEAGKSLMRLANILMGQEPAEAVKALDDMIDVLDKEGLRDRFVRGAALHARANRLAKLHRHSEAFRDASEAIDLLRGLLGAEKQLVGTLHLAALEACYMGLTDRANALSEEAEKLTDELQIPHFQLSEEVSRLAQLYDPALAEEILKKGEASKNLEVIAAVRIIQATNDPSLENIERLGMLEDMHSRLMASRGRKPMLRPVKHAIGRQLARMEELQRAIQWFKRVLVDDPHDALASIDLVNSLWKMEKWIEAANFVREQMDLVGEKPGMLLAYGRSLFEAGDMSGAVTALTRSLSLAGENEDVQQKAKELRERALNLGGTILPPSAPKAAAGPVTREEFETALDEFARFVSAEKRMGFWNKPSDSDYVWIARPEKRAQDLLHTALKIRFGDRIEVFEEIATGAGRLDLYAKLNGGLSIIIELKMCGFGYSSSYAAAGEEQINHYMDNRNTNLGYLVVFDARIDDFGQTLLSGTPSPHTIIEKFVDVRPRVRRS
jgi:tetratricopeptide (TPR) repeat protein